MNRIYTAVVLAVLSLFAFVSGRTLTWRDLLKFGIVVPIVGGVGDETGTIAALLKEFYPGGGIISQVNAETYLLDKTELNKKYQFNGEYWTKPANFGFLGASGSRAEGAALPAAGSSTLDSPKIYSKFHYGVIQVSGPAMAASRTTKGAFKQAMAHNMDLMYDEFRLVMEIFLHGFGSAVIGVVDSVAASVITLKDNVLPPQWFFENLKIDSYQSNESTLRQAAMKVTDVNLATREITVDTIGSTAATDRLYVASSKDVVPDGLFSAVDDSTYKDAYFGITRTAVGKKKWKSYVNAQGGTATKYGNATRRTLTEGLIETALNEQMVRAAGRHIGLFYSGLGVRSAFFQQLAPGRRYNSEVYDGGWKQIKYSYGDTIIPWHASWLAPKYTLFGLYTGSEPAPREKGRAAKVEDEEALGLFEMEEAGWDKATGAELKQIYSGANFVDAVGAFLKWYLNWGTCRPNAHVRVDDLKEASVA